MNAKNYHKGNLNDNRQCIIEQKNNRTKQKKNLTTVKTSNISRTFLGN